MVTGLITVDEPQAGKTIAKKIMVCDECGEHEGQHPIATKLGKDGLPTEEVWLCTRCFNDSNGTVMPIPEGFTTCDHCEAVISEDAVVEIGCGEPKLQLCDTCATEATAQDDEEIIRDIQTEIHEQSSLP